MTKEFAYSNDGIKKICKQFEITKPDGSYWSKLKFNKKFKKEKLNPIFGGVDKIVLTIREEESKVNLDQTPLTIRTKEIESDPKAPLIVVDEITKPDILILNTKNYHLNRKKKDFVWNDKLDTVSIYVEETNYNRALLIMDSFIKLLRHRGHSFRRDINNRGPRIVVFDVEFSFNIREKNKRILSTKLYETATYLPTGILIMQIGESFRAKEWIDGSTKLENKLASILAKIELEAEKELLWREECRLHHIQREEEKIRFEAIKKRRDEEVTKYNKLVALSEQYNKTLLIRQYIEAEKQKAINTNNLHEKQEWINWANDKADWLDPLINKHDDILDAK